MVQLNAALDPTRTGREAEYLEQALHRNIVGPGRSDPADRQYLPDESDRDERSRSTDRQLPFSGADRHAAKLASWKLPPKRW